ncbi:MAG TPA: signal peptide peptidase SppA [Sphingobium sp.]|nr:signal peptide peptidase SppA [Sphingobium sp.]
MNFAKSAWKLIVALKDLMVLLFLMGFFALLYAGLKQARSVVDQAPQTGALYLALDGPIVEQPSVVGGLSSLAGSGTPVQYRLRDVVHAIETAAGDNAIKAVVLDLGAFGGGGQVAMERVGAALDKVRAAKKPVLVHATVYDDDGYMLAAHASEVWLSPLGMVGVTGPGGNTLYYQGLIDKLGARIHVYRVGTYKSAVEPFIRTDQSPEARAANEALLAAVWEDWLAHVGKARPGARIGAFLADPMAALKSADGDLAQAALKLGLVDKLGDSIAFGSRVVALAGQAQQGGPGDFAAIPLKSYLSRHKPPADGAVGVVTVAGDIVDGTAPPGTAGGATIANLIRDAMADDSIKALVLRVDSPGGSVTASEDIRAALMQAKARGLPVIVSMANVAASGGYWVSTPADVIFAEPATITGSIGVFGIVPSFEQTLAKAGITSDGVWATPLSGQPDLIGGVTPEYNALAQASVEDIYRRFVGLVAQARKLTPARVDEIGQGRVWAGGAAHQLQLIDRFGGLEEAIAEAAKRAGLSGSQARPRYFDPQGDRISQILALMGQEDGEALRSAAASAPRDWLSLSVARQRQWAAQALRDLRALVDGPAIRADCLECRTFGAPPAPVSPAETGWLARLLAAMQD